MSDSFDGLQADRPLQFFETDPLVDEELELVPPSGKLIDEMLAACRHRTTRRLAPESARVTRRGLEAFLSTAPGGLFRGDPAFGYDLGYHFWMRLPPGRPFRIAGAITLRIGDSVDLQQWVGHLGYRVFPLARGQHLAERACRLLLPLARRHGMQTLWITCNPDNAASRRTCERMGARYVETVQVPPTHALFSLGDRLKQRFRLAL